MKKHRLTTLNLQRDTVRILTTGERTQIAGGASTFPRDCDKWPDPPLALAVAKATHEDTCNICTL